MAGLGGCEEEAAGFAKGWDVGVEEGSCQGRLQCHEWKAPFPEMKEGDLRRRGEQEARPQELAFGRVLSKHIIMHLEDSEAVI